MSFADKIYWRRRTDLGKAHAFKATNNYKGGKRVFIALCDVGVIVGSGGGKQARPPAVLRCARCDCAEMARRGWTESGPEDKGWEDQGTR